MSDLWCPEFNACIDPVLEKGAEKYSPRDWEKPESRSVMPLHNCDAIFHHLARERVYQENKQIIDQILNYTPDPYAYQLCMKLKYDEMGTRHLQHTATRSVMGHTRELRGLD